MNITYEQRDEILTIFLSGDIDHHNAAYIREAVDEITDSSHARHLILNFKDIAFMDSSGIGLIMGRFKKMQALGGDVVVAGAKAATKRILKLSGIERLVKIV